jgi:hypothetical protein
MAYSKAKLKSSGDKVSHCFRSFWIGKLSEKIFLKVWNLERSVVPRYFQGVQKRTACVQMIFKVNKGLF